MELGSEVFPIFHTSIGADSALDSVQVAELLVAISI